MDPTKQAVQDFWSEASCGERLLLPSVDRTGFSHQADERYRLEPYIESFAGFEKWKGLDVLEIGVGLGADHQRFVEAGAATTGVDLTPRAIALCGERLLAFGLRSNLQVADAESLPFPENSFDLVYSWGVIHHSPDTPSAVREIFRVLRPGATVKVMICHKWSMVGLMLWIRYALLRGRPWVGMHEIYSSYLESPGTKAYTIEDARHLFADFTAVRVSTVLTHGDLLESAAGQRHRGPLLSIARATWPRRFIKRFLPGAGLFLLVEARKPLVQR